MVDFDLPGELRSRPEYALYVIAGRIVPMGLLVAVVGIVGSTVSAAGGFVWLILVGGFFFALGAVTVGTVTYAVIFPAMMRTPGYVDLGDIGLQADFIGNVVADLVRLRRWRSFG